MKSVLIHLIFFLCILFSNSAHAGGIIFEDSTSFSAALLRAHYQNRILFIDCYTAWCGPCRILASVVFTDSEVGQYFNGQFVNAKFDMEKGDGKEIAKRYHIRAYPTLLWLRDDGTEIMRQRGSCGKQELMSLGALAIDSSQRMQASNAVIEDPFNIQMVNDPTEGNAKLRLSNEYPIDAEVLITEQSGRVLTNSIYHFEKGLSTIDLNSMALPNGIYIVSVKRQGTSIALSKLVISR